MKKNISHWTKNLHCRAATALRIQFFKDKEINLIQITEKIAALGTKLIPKIIRLLILESLIESQNIYISNIPMEEPPHNMKNQHTKPLQAKIKAIIQRNQSVWNP